MVKQHVRALLDLLCRFGQRQLDSQWVVEQILGKGLDAIRHGCAEQEGLPLFLALFRNPHDVTVKTHVQHAVGLIQNQARKLGEVDIPQRQMGKESTRCGNDDIRSLCQRFLLS